MKKYASLEAFLADLPQLALEVKDKLQGHSGLYAFRLPDRQYFIRLEDGAVTVTLDAQQAPDCTITAAGDQLLALINGEANPMKALLLGKVRAQGDVKALLRLIALL